jgi:hypothetical protein
MPKDLNNRMFEAYCLGWQKSLTLWLKLKFRTSPDYDVCLP